MRYENPCDARLLREAYARTTRRPHTETFADKVVRDSLYLCSIYVTLAHLICIYKSIYMHLICIYIYNEYYYYIEVKLKTKYIFKFEILCDSITCMLHTIRLQYAQNKISIPLKIIEKFINLHVESSQPIEA